MNQRREELTWEFAMTVADMAHRWRVILDDRLRPKGFSQATWRTLFFTNRAPEGIIQKDLASAIGIEGPSLARLLDNLEGEGLIERRTHAADRRRKTVHLTAAGDSRLREIHAVAERAWSKIVEDVSDSDILECLEVFGRVRRNADEMRKADK